MLDAILPSCNADAIFQTVRELFENAHDATSARGGCVKVTLELNRAASELHVVVEDDGPSMRAADVPGL